MIQLYRSMSFFNKDDIIVDNEAFFNNYINAKFIKEYGVYAIKSIDKAILIDENTAKVQTPFGICSIDDLSSGCKTILNIIYINEKHLNRYDSIIVSLNECGRNALDFIFDYIEDNSIDIKFVLEHDDDTFKCRQHNYLINGKYKCNTIPLNGDSRA